MPAAPTPYRALLVDIDGVLYNWPASDAEIETAHGLPEGILRQIAFRRDLLTPAITGAITDEAWRAQIVAELARTYPDSRTAEAVAMWTQRRGGLATDVLALIDQLSDAIKVLLISNATSRLNSDLAELGLSTHFYAVINSSEVGSIKPEPAIFHAALAAADVTADQTLFVDDSAKNVAGAEKLGIRSHHFTGIDGFTAFLRAAGVLDQAS